MCPGAQGNLRQGSHGGQEAQGTPHLHADEAKDTQDPVPEYQKRISAWVLKAQCSH